MRSIPFRNSKYCNYETVQHFSHPLCGRTFLESTSGLALGCEPSTGCCVIAQSSHLAFCEKKMSSSISQTVPTGFQSQVMRGWSSECSACRNDNSKHPCKGTSWDIVCQWWSLRYSLFRQIVFSVRNSKDMSPNICNHFKTTETKAIYFANIKTLPPCLKLKSATLSI